MGHSKDSHEHAHPPGGHGHAHGEPYVWQPGARPRRTGLWLVLAGVVLVLAGLLLRWIASPK